jgi:hypothetical protein
MNKFRCEEKINIWFTKLKVEILQTNQIKFRVADDNTKNESEYTCTVHVKFLWHNIIHKYFGLITHWSNSSINQSINVHVLSQLEYYKGKSQH